MVAPLIRAATIEDLGRINDIYNFYVATSPATFDTEPIALDAREAWFRTRQERRLPVLVAEVGSEVAGWCALSPWSPKKAYDTTCDESIYVDERFRGQGIGKALLAEILEQARALGLHVVMAGVVACQDASLALHRSLGFEQSAMNLHMGYKLGAWHDVAYLQRHLWRESS